MKRFGRLIYNLISGAGFLVALSIALVAFVGKDYHGNSILDLATNVTNNAKHAPMWEWVFIIGSIVISLIGIVFCIFSIIFFFRDKDKFLWSNILFIFMSIALTLSLVVYFVN